jgi:hypothetical protein
MIDCPVSADEARHADEEGRAEDRETYLKKIECEASEQAISDLTQAAADGHIKPLSVALDDFQQSFVNDSYRMGMDQINDLLVSLLAKYARLQGAGRVSEMPSEVGSIFGLVSEYIGDQAGGKARNEAEKAL